MVEGKKQRAAEVLCAVVTTLSIVAIFRFSGQDSEQSNALSYGLTARILALLPMENTVENLDRLNFILRKLAHFGLYFFLGSGLTGLAARRGKRVPVALLVTVLGGLLAVSDEFHQRFSQGRFSSGWDVLLDLSGVAVGWGAFQLLKRQRKLWDGGRMGSSRTTTKVNCTGVSEQDSGRRGYLTVKRGQDIVLSALALAVLLPLLLIIALLIVIDDPHGGPIFSHLRVGKGGKLFRMYKFRTMCVDAEAKREQLSVRNEMHGPTFKIKHDPRITKIGGFLRRTSLDELPQLVNILHGDMSIVGPRPALPAEVAQYTEYQLQRLKVTPGLTCFWQLHPSRYRMTMDEWVELDIKYIRERSWALDWLLIFRTFGVVLKANGE